MNQWLKDHCTNGFLCTQSESKIHKPTGRIWKRQGPTAKGLDNVGTTTAEDLPVENTCMIHELCYKGRGNSQFCAISLC